MPFEARETTAGGLLIGTELVTMDDGVAALGLLQDHPDWTHLVVDVSASDSPFILSRDEELGDLHQLARIVRDLQLRRGFRIALVRSARTAARVADFIDLARTLAVDLEVASFDSF